MTSPTLRNRVFSVLIGDTRKDALQKKVNGGLALLIVLNLVAVVLETVQSIQARYEFYFWTFEAFSVFVFSVEYGLRLWSCVESNKIRTPVAGRLRYALSPLLIIDLLAILPFFLSFLLPSDLRFLRVLRLLRLLRFFRLGRYSGAMMTFAKVLKSKKEQLLVSFLALLVLLFISSSLVYLAENEAQPDKFPDIPETLWWGVITLTTVGYGDVYPVTIFGKIFSGIVATLGIGMFAVPGGILASGFTEQSGKGKHMVCPHCGIQIDHKE